MPQSIDLHQFFDMSLTHKNRGVTRCRTHIFTDKQITISPISSCKKSEIDKPSNENNDEQGFIARFDFLRAVDKRLNVTDFVHNLINNAKERETIEWEALEETYLEEEEVKAEYASRCGG